MTPCEETRHAMEDLLHGTLPAEAAVALRAHVLACPACAAELEDREELALLVERRATRHAAPPAFRESLRETLAGEGLLAVPARARPGVFRRVALPVPVSATAAVLLLVRGAALWFKPWVREAPTLVAPLAAVVEDHQRALLALRAQGPSPVSPETARERLGPQAGYGPILRFAGSEVYRLAGVRASYFLERPAATVTYARDGRLATYLVFPGKDVTIPEAGRVRVETFKPHLAEVEGLRIVTWREGEWACVLVGNLDRQEILDLFLKVRKG